MIAYFHLEENYWIQEFGTLLKIRNKIILQEKYRDYRVIKNFNNSHQHT